MMKPLNFQGTSGHELAGWLHTPDDAPRAILIFAHCFTCSKDLHMVRTIARAVCQRGFAMLRFDFTGVGQSGGDFADTTLISDVGDLELAAATLRQSLGEDLPLGLMGHSLGGTACLLAAARVPAVRAMALLASPLDPTDLPGKLGPDVAHQARSHGAVPVTIGGRSFSITDSFMDSLHQPQLPALLANFPCPLLLLHGTEDRTVSLAVSEQIFALAPQPKGFEPLPGADHLLTRKRDAQLAADLLGLWFERFLT
jgi:uncharacterized protein